MAATAEPYRSPKTLDIVFAVSCAAMMLATIWMFAADYRRDYKNVQRTFRDVEATLAQREMLDKLPDPALVADLRKDVTAAKKKLARAKEKVADTERKLTAKRESADEHYRGIKADLDAESSYYNIAADEAGTFPRDSSRHYKSLLKESEHIREKKVVPLENQLAAAKTTLDEIDAQIKDKVRSVTDEPEKELATAEDELKKQTAVFDRFAKLAAQKSWGSGDTFRSLPILDGFESPTKIRQQWLPDLTIDMGGFKDAARYDRCTTCHLGIDRGHLRARLARQASATRTRTAASWASSSRPRRCSRPARTPARTSASTPPTCPASLTAPSAGSPSSCSAASSSARSR